MKINQLTVNSHRPLFESYGLTDQYFETWQRDIHPVLCEVAMDPAQIENLFKSVEKGAGRSGFGKAADAVKGAAGAVKGAADKISDVWFNKFGGMLQNSDMVQGFDAKWEQIKTSVAEKNPQLASALGKYKEFADKNPKTQKFLLGIAASAAAAGGVALAGGLGASALAVGTGAGVATGIINIADRLLKNEKLSTAVGRGVTAGAIAGLTAGGLKKAQDALSSLGATKFLDNGIRELNVNGTKFYLKPEEFDEYQKGVRASMKILNDPSIHANLGDAINASAAADAANLANILKKVANTAYQQEAISQIGTITEIPPGAVGQAANVVADLLNKVGPALSGIAGTAAGGAGQKKESIYRVRNNTLTEAQLNELFGITGNKVDAATLMKAWKKAGSPTDSEAVAKLLTDNGVDSNVVSTAFTDIGAEVPNSISGTKTEPTMDTDPTTGKTPAGDTPAPAPKPGETPAPAPAPKPGETPASGDAPAAASGTIFDDYKKLFTMWNEYRDNDGKILPQFRGVLRDILMTALKTVEGKQVFNSAERILAEAMLNELGNRPNDSTDVRVAGGVPNAVGNLKDRRKQRADTLAKNQAAAQEPAPAPSPAPTPAPAPSPAPSPAPTPAPAPEPDKGEKPAPAPMPGGSGDLWDKIVQGFYRSGRITTNPRDNVAQKIGNWATKSGGYTVGYDSKPGTGANLDGTKGDTYGGGEEQAPKQLGYGFGGTNKGKQQGPAPAPKPGETPAPTSGETPAPTTTPAPGESPAPTPAPGETPAPTDTGKKHTGGKKKGELSNSPNAIRKRNARAAAAGKAPADAGANAFGQMAGQLGGSNTTTSSTGGTTTQTPTGQVHKANPSNPNQPQAAPASEPASEPATAPAPRQSLKQRLAAKQALKQSAEIIAEPIVESVKTTEVNSVLESFARLNKVIKKNAESKK